MSFRHRVIGEVFTLAYNQVNKTPTVPQKPDNMLSLKRQVVEMSYQYVIDAKYRLNYLETKEEILEVLQEEDINTMHRYRDAIFTF